jgi:hypothetical protein
MKIFGKSAMIDRFRHDLCWFQDLQSIGSTITLPLVRAKRLVGGGYANQGKSATLGKKLII